MAHTPAARSGALLRGSSGGGVGQEVRVPKTAELVAAALRRQIIKGELSPQVMLPPEPALMEQFGVSRPTLREAFRVLEAESLISVRRGLRGGAQVNAPDVAVAARYAGLILQYQGASVGDVCQARAMIEPSFARLLAARQEAGDLARMRAALAAELAAADDLHALAAARNAFHSTLADVTGNRTLSLLSGVLEHIVERSGAAHDQPDGPHTAGREQADPDDQAHARLVELAAGGKADEAEALWRRHCGGDDSAVGEGRKTAQLNLLG
jgi:DNA-binding FadR family transcriptional regulator